MKWAPEEENSGNSEFDIVLLVLLNVKVWELDFASFGATENHFGYCKTIRWFLQQLNWWFFPRTELVYIELL